MLADQVMQLVPAAGGLGDQVLVVEAFQVPAGGVHAAAIQRRGSICVDVGARVHAQPAEKPPLAVVQVLVGQAERGRDRQVLGCHQLQPVAGGGQVAGQARGGPGGVVGQLAGQHPDRQRQVPAQRGDPGHLRIVGGHVGAAGQAGQQVRGLVRGQGVQGDQGGVFQRGQPAPAGYQHHAARRARQQRPDLLMPGCIIEHQQDLLPGGMVAPAGRPRIGPRRDLAPGHSGGQQQTGQGVGRDDRPLPRGVGVQRQEELPVAETAGQPVRGVHREGRLADPGHPADRVNRHHPASIGRLSPPRHQLPELGLAAGEGGDVSRQRPAGRRRPRPGRSRSGRQRLIRRRAAPRGRYEQIAGRAVQAQRAGQQHRGVLAGGGVDAALQVADRPLAHPRGLGQLVLSQPSLVAQLP